MRVNTSRRSVSRIAYEAMAQGSPVAWWVGSGPHQCTNPVELHMFGYPDEIGVKLGTEPDVKRCIRGYGRCRKCDGCLRHRARLWTARAIDETKVSTRTWFGTLTLAPDRQTWARYSALKRIGERCGDPDPENVWRTTVEVLNEELTLFLKRLRKVAPFRYLLVTEAHQSGLPHFHMLIHEYAGSISKRVLDDRWRFGFSQWRLVPPGNEKACGYVCKYLAKSALTRIRASEAYGREGATRRLTERVLDATLNVAQLREGDSLPVQQQ